MNIEEVQRRLWEQSREHQDQREADTPLFPTDPYEGRIRNLMELMHNTTWIAAACQRVLKRSRGKASGVDGVTVSDFERNRDQRLEELRLEVKRGTYQPRPLRRVEIPKANGKMRRLGIPCLRDKIVQESMRMALEPIFEVEFHESSCGFRPNRNTHHAVFRCRQLAQAGYSWVIEVDVIRGWSNYFSIAHNYSKVASSLDHKSFWIMVNTICRKKDISTAQCLRKYDQKNILRIYPGCSLARFSDTKMSLDYRGPRPYEPGQGIYSTDAETEVDFRLSEKRRPGRADLKWQALIRDGYHCRGCGVTVTARTSHADHIDPVHRFASFQQANSLDNIQTLC